MASQEVKIKGLGKETVFYKLDFTDYVKACKKRFVKDKIQKEVKTDLYDETKKTIKECTTLKKLQLKVFATYSTSVSYYMKQYKSKSLEFAALKNIQAAAKKNEVAIDKAIAHYKDAKKSDTSGKDKKGKNANRVDKLNGQKKFLDELLTKVNEVDAQANSDTKNKKTYDEITNILNNKIATIDVEISDAKTLEGNKDTYAISSKVTDQLTKLLVWPNN